MAGPEAGALAARARALKVLRVRGAALAVALLPAAVAVVLHVGGATGRLGGPGGGWAVARWAVSGVAVIVLLLAALVTAVVVRARPALSPSVPVAEESAPDLYRLVRDLAERLDVPAPSAIALTPDCDSWLEDRTHRAHGPPPARTAPSAAGRRRGRGADGTDGDRAAGEGRGGREGRDGSAGAGGGEEGRGSRAPVLVIGSPFLWWMRVAELRALLAPVVAGTGPSANPDIAAARRFVRGLDAAVAVTSRARGPLSRLAPAFVGGTARLLLRACRDHAMEMERGVAAAASERAQAVDYGLRIVAQEQVGLAYAGWDRLLTRVALPAWRMGRWPSRLDAGVVSALTELSRRDRLAEGFASRLGERPACDLLEEPGAIDRAASLLAARLFHGGPAEPGPDWSPVNWQQYPEEVVDRKWRLEAARLHRVLDGLPPAEEPAHTTAATAPAAPLAPPVTTAESATAADATTVESGTTAESATAEPAATAVEVASAPVARTEPSRPADPIPAGGTAGSRTHGVPGAHGKPEANRMSEVSGASGMSEVSGVSGVNGALGVNGLPESNGLLGAPAPGMAGAPESAGTPGIPGTSASDPGPQDCGPTLGRVIERLTRDVRAAELVAARLGAELEREEREEAARREARRAARQEARGRSARGGPGADCGDGLPDDGVPLFPLQPPRTGRELLADHVTAMVCCAAIDTAGAAPGLDWLDGPALLVGGERRADLGRPVRSLVDDGDADPLRGWLSTVGVRPEKPVRLV
ncbi:hypothetical protein [Streptomyces sp. MST-110588]|uniref:hypothetical protein n=1 Tax=Streptomyces sp. MST-110588 TaxID=2833628 RepID=UPI001F5D1EE4|nr:hypothetical protein [Streptomyces sp. MST-110588]UNO41168.1 hypothetical protein KGS77_18225 [Streptomyces sp. MST-110588]